jgi:diguanylate cyclase (GGDEF)-like protein
MSGTPAYEGQFSLSDAIAVVARGGPRAAQLVALAERARALAGASRATVLLLEPGSGVLATADGSLVLPAAEAGAAVDRAIHLREAVTSAPAPGLLRGPLGEASACAVAPLLFADDGGLGVLGVLVLAWPADEAPTGALSEEVLALADLMAVSAHLADLRLAIRKQAASAEGQSHIDPLTGLADRATFERMLELEIARADRLGTPLSVTVLPVDGLHAVRESRGAAHADDVLLHVAAALVDQLRLLDTVARFDASAFAVIAPGDAGGISARRVRDAIAALPPLDGTRLSVSAAVVHHPQDGERAAELLVALEALQQRAREAGPGALLGEREAVSQP